MDFSEDSIQNLPYAIELAKKNRAELIILYSYRLINDSSKAINNMVELKVKYETKAKKSFENLKISLLNEPLVSTSFLCEIGFLSDRIVANVVSNSIDLVVLTNKTEHSLINEMSSFKEKLMDKITCPMLILTKTADLVY